MERRSREKGWKKEAPVKERMCDESFFGVVVVIM